jgi:Fur family ferric uptake transcriptional regulator
MDAVKLKEVLKEKGYKYTKQREIILDVLINNDNLHLSPEDVYQKLQNDHPEIGLATVYRNLQLLENLGILYKINLNDGCNRYELSLKDENAHHHHHLICLKCGKVEEFENDYLEDLERIIEQEKGFKTEDHVLKFFGECKSCRDKV